MEFMFSEKGTKLLIIDNYKFGFQKNLTYRGGYVQNDNVKHTLN
jgi:hypothetical protein